MFFEHLFQVYHDFLKLVYQLGHGSAGRSVVIELTHEVGVEDDASTGY